MATRIADTLKQQNNLDTFPVAYGEDLWLDENKGHGSPSYASIQALYNRGELGGNSVQVEVMPEADAESLGMIVQYIGADTVSYKHGYFYECVTDGQPTPTFSWQVTPVSDAPTATTSTLGVVKGGDGTEIGAQGQVNVVNRLEETTELPTATAANERKCYLLTEAQTGYTVGGTYQCQEVTPATDPKTYHWVLISAADVDLTKYKKIFMGAKDDFLALPEATRKEYDELHTDETESGESSLQPKILENPVAGATTVEGALSALDGRKVLKPNGGAPVSVDAQAYLATLASQTGFSAGNVNFTGTCTNLPENKTAMNTLVMMQRVTANYARVILMDCYSTDIWEAYVSGTFWTSWTKLATATSVALSSRNGSTIYSDNSRVVDKIVTICADIIVQSGSSLVKENTVAQLEGYGTSGIGYVLPCLYRNTSSGAEEPSFAIIQTNGNIYPYYTNSNYNEIRINTSYVRG